MATAAAKKAAAPAQVPSTYVVISPLDHDGERYAIDDEVELTDAQAAPLLGHTVAKAAPAKPAG